MAKKSVGKMVRWQMYRCAIQQVMAAASIAILGMKFSYGHLVANIELARSQGVVLSITALASDEGRAIASTYSVGLGRGV